MYSRISILLILDSAFLGLNLIKSLLTESIGLFGGLFHSSAVTQKIQIFVLLVSAAILQLTASYPRKVLIQAFSSFLSLFRFKVLYEKTDVINMMGQQYKIIEYPLVVLFIITGALFLISSSDIVSIFLSIELQSYGLYLLATLYRDSEGSTSAGLTYFLLGGLASCFIVLGTSLLYVNSGTTNLEGYYIITSLSSIANELKANILDLYKPLYINISLIIMSVGFLFKMSAAPFHFWSPDVYDAIPTVVTTFAAIIPKVSILVFLLQLVHYTSNSFSTLSFTWTNGLLFSSFLSLMIGTVLGLSQSRIKRLYAYSTISHLGFILLALSINSIESIQAFIFYLIQYTISNLNAFILLITIGYSLYRYVYLPPCGGLGEDKKQYVNLLGSALDKNNSPIQLISQIKGYFHMNPILALSLAITLFSFVGIPPLIGFFAKQMVLSAALKDGYIFLSLVAILTSVISAVYYLAVIKEIFFEKSNYQLNRVFFPSGGKNESGLAKQENVVYLESYDNKSIKSLPFNYDSLVLSSHLTITISVLTLIILLFIFTANESLRISNIFALLVFNP